MEAKIRLDGSGNPYLSIKYVEPDFEDACAEDDAERLFFTRLNQNGGSIHLMPGRGKAANLLVIIGQVKRSAPVLDTLANPEGMATPEEVQTLKESLDNLMAPPTREDLALPVDVADPNLQNPSLDPVF